MARLEVLVAFIIAAVLGTQAVPLQHEVIMEDLRSQQAPSTRIVAGWPAQEAQIPHQIHFRMFNSVGASSSCGGSIIHHSWVLTAAHCVANRFTFLIRVGLTNLTRPEHIVESSRRYIHPGYWEPQAGVQTDDIALLQLDQSIPYSRTVQPCRLMNSAQRNLDFTGVVFTVSGYGLTDDVINGGAVSETLNWVHLRGIANGQCLAWYPNSQVIREQTICAEFYNNTAQSSCQGDSGGPLTFVDFDGQPTMVGVVSFGSTAGCNSPWPAGYVRPGHYHDWMTQITGLSFDWRQNGAAASGQQWYSTVEQEPAPLRLASSAEMMMPA